ncbi:hypothetical protein JHW43_000222 [Diplocarpon mali]|nr:hypothetical protein JHW43_000222 [Diplocarpon mali]
MTTEAGREDRNEALLRAVILQLDADFKLDYVKLAADMGIKRDAARKRWSRYKKKLDESKNEERDSIGDGEDEVLVKSREKKTDKPKPAITKVDAGAAEAKRACQNVESTEWEDDAVQNFQEPEEQDRSSEEQRGDLESGETENIESDA